ncbi:hypothetical protein [Kribbella sindirgiensis]|uniref:Uncharacterized protein n=1 Tax=Kribbella sindirgiensis TaxID=1124744 RepID=A0A4R0IWF2_9ACTN|nr:hypothetical protein [Kribbella sindirgiensis]TCC36934.1 hypothetical protein E0H50_09615 [Kribbella sindirgiensis]
MSDASAFEVEFPKYLDGYEFETESKGYLFDVIVRSGTRQWSVTVYDVARLHQEVSDEVQASGGFALSNLLVVDRVTRSTIFDALSELANSDFVEFSQVEI